MEPAREPAQESVFRGLNLRLPNTAEVDLDAWARRWIARTGLPHSAESNPLLDATICQQMVDDLHFERGLRRSFGGYLEDRSFLWAGSYLETSGAFTHLGIDVNVPAGTRLSFHTAVEVVHVDNDFPELHGWGPRVIARPLDGGPDAPLIIYGHLRNVRCRAGQTYPAGTPFAEVGEPPANGGWFEHAHLQLVSSRFFESLRTSGRIGELDGYGLRSDIAMLRERYPDPVGVHTHRIIFGTFGAV